MPLPSCPGWWGYPGWQGWGGASAPWGALLREGFSLRFSSRGPFPCSRELHLPDGGRAQQAPSAGSTNTFHALRSVG